MAEDKEVNEFDKFMDEICEGEAKKVARAVDVEVDTPARLYNKRYREHAHNRIVYRRGK